MVLLLALTSLWAFQDNSRVIYLVEEVVYDLPGLPREVSKRHIYIGDDSVRTDFDEENIRLIYNMKLGTFVIVNMDSKTYYLSRPGRKKQLSRTPLLNLVPLKDDMLTLQGGPLVVPTGKRAIIANSDCREFRVNYRSNLGVSTYIWATTIQIKDRNEFKKIFYAASGTKPPQDVRDVFHRIFKEIEGAPVRIVSEVEQEGFLITSTSTYIEIDRNFKADDSFFLIPENFSLEQDPKERPWQEEVIQ